MAIPIFFNLHDLPQETCGCPYLDFLYEADRNEFIKELSKKVPGVTKKVWMMKTLNSHGEVLAKTKEERFEQMQQYTNSGMCDRMLDFLERNPKHTVVDSMLGVAVKYIDQ